jgi:hypothetical protein
MAASAKRLQLNVRQDETHAGAMMTCRRGASPSQGELQAKVQDEMERVEEVCVEQINGCAEAAALAGGGATDMRENG